MTSTTASDTTGPPSERIDAHHHLWRYDTAEFGWLTDDMAVLRRDFLVPELESTLRGSGVDRAVAVQARCTLEETDFLLECARLSSCIAGVVGWVPLTDAGVGAVLDRLASDPRFCGVREIAQGQASGFLERPAFEAGIRELTQRDLTYDLLIYADQLLEATRLVGRHTNQRFVLDHAAKPPIARGTLTPWQSELRELAKCPNVTCKLSGLVTEADWSGWTLDALTPYLDTCVEAFGPARLLAGSDWPVCLVATEYGRWWSTLELYFASFSTAERNSIFGSNAVREYRLPPPHPSFSEIP